MLPHTPDTGMLAHLFVEIANALNGKGNLFTDGARHMMQTLIAIEIVFLGLWMALDGGSAIRRSLTAVLRFGLFYWLVTGWPRLIAIVHDGFAQAGSKISGSLATTDTLIALTGRILNDGANACHGLLVTINQLSLDSARNSGGISLLVLCYALSMGGFFLVAAQILLVSVEFLAAAALGIILLPFGVFSRTAFLAENVMRMVVVLGVRKMVMILLTLTLIGQYDYYAFPNTPLIPDMAGAIPQAFNLMFWALAMGLLVWRVPLQLSALMHKAPALYPQQSDTVNSSQPAASVATATASTHNVTAMDGGIEATQAAADALPSGHSATDVPTDPMPAGRIARIQQRMSARLKK